MKFTLTGSLGNIGKPLATHLLQAGHQVTIISSNAGKKALIESMGARAAIGSVSDVQFLTNVFRGADAIYTMVPEILDTDDYRVSMAGIGSHYAAAIHQAGVQRVVNLSSIGAHLSHGTGPIAGLHDVERILNALDGVSVTHLRPGFFYTNFYHDVEMIRNRQIIGNNYDAQCRLIMVHPRDIAEAAAMELQKPFSDYGYRYVVSDDRRTADIAQALGTAVGQSGLRWVQFTDEEAYAGMIQAGMPAAIATTYIEMGNAVQSGILWEDYDRQKPQPGNRTSLEDFAREFAITYHQ